MILLKWLLGLTAGFLVGSFPTAYIVGHNVRGIDIRRHGSGNAGATNAFRVIGKAWGFGVLGIDMLKGFVAASILPHYLRPFEQTSLIYPLTLGVAAIIGHTWTPWLGFKGGKGVATSAGVFLGLAPQAAGLALLVWIVIFSWKKYVSLASLVTALSFPIFVFFFYKDEQIFPILFPISMGLAIFIFYTHRENIRRLHEGREKRLI